MKTYCYLFLVSLALRIPLQAAGLLNGDFTEGKSHWEGPARLTYQKEDGTIEPIDDDNSSDLNTDNSFDNTGSISHVPVLAIKLNKSIFHQLSQTFLVEPGTKKVQFTLVYNVSSDFKRNDKSLNFTANIPVGPEQNWIWTGGYIWPKVDFFMRLENVGDRNMYYTHNAKPSDDWRTVSGTLDDINDSAPVTFNLIVAPGAGTFYVKSVTCK